MGSQILMSGAVVAGLILLIATTLNYGLRRMDGMSHEVSLGESSLLGAFLILSLIIDYAIVVAPLP